MYRWLFSFWWQQPRHSLAQQTLHGISFLVWFYTTFLQPFLRTLLHKPHISINVIYIPPGSYALNIPTLASFLKLSSCWWLYRLYQPTKNPISKFCSLAFSYLQSSSWVPRPAGIFANSDIYFPFCLTTLRTHELHYEDCLYKSPGVSQKQGPTLIS